MRLLAAHWPVLLMWFAGGHLARFYAIELAGTVGAYSALGGMVLLPLAVLARLISFGAMLLVLRDGMRQLRAIAPLPEGRIERRRSFVDALFGGMLPFVAFYAAWGFLREDAANYTTVALDLQRELRLAAFGRCVGDTPSDQPVMCEDAGAAFTGQVDMIGLNAVTITIIVLAFAGRFVWKKWRARLPKFLAIVAVYVECLWTFLSIYVIGGLLNGVTAWIQQRQAMVWLGDIRAWVNSQFDAIAWVWDGVEWFVGEAGGIILLPITWLTIAGVIYGQAVVAKAPRLARERVGRFSTAFGRVPSWLRRRLSDLGLQLISLFRPIWAALVLMWRAGPVAIGSYVLLYTVLLAADETLLAGLTRVVGPREQQTWEFLYPALALAVTLLIEPVRIALIASAYDGTIGKLRARRAADEAEQSEIDVDVDDAQGDVSIGRAEITDRDLQLQGEGPGRVGGDDEGERH